MIRYYVNCEMEPVPAPAETAQGNLLQCAHALELASTILEVSALNAPYGSATERELYMMLMQCNALASNLVRYNESIEP